jgi:hypothetical protein
MKNSQHLRKGGTLTVFVETLEGTKQGYYWMENDLVLYTSRLVGSSISDETKVAMYPFPGSYDNTGDEFTQVDGFPILSQQIPKS